MKAVVAALIIVANGKVAPSQRGLRLQLGQHQLQLDHEVLVTVDAPLRRLAHRGFAAPRGG